MDNGSRRVYRATGRRAAAVALLAVLTVSAASLAQGTVGNFVDDDGSVHETDIEATAANGITRGCNPPDNTRFCPVDFVTRSQMAAFLHRALDDTLQATDPVTFIDDDGSTFEADIQWLGATGVTRGCNPPTNDRFCPDDHVTRGQMAAFLHRALHDTLQATDPVTFIDDDGSTFEADIQWLGATGVTRGCNPPDNTRFCPDDFVTRAQMASFLVRVLDPDMDDDPSTTASTTTTAVGASSTTSTTQPVPPPPPPGDAQWVEISDGTGPADRHEAGFVRVGDRLYLLGGRRTIPIEYFDLTTGNWVDTGESTDQVHHFQPVAIGDRIFIVGALTGGCCTVDKEPPSDWVMVFDTRTNQLDKTFHPIPAEFRRGATGAVVYQGEIYIVSGNTGGHGDIQEPLVTRNLNAFTRYDPEAPSEAQRWEALPPIPHPRDHFHAVVVGSKLYVVGGRTSEDGPFGDGMFAAVVPEVDVYDFDTGHWSTQTSLPFPRAAAATAAVGVGVYVIGGEGGSMSNGDDPAWDRVDRLDTASLAWDQLDSIPIPRHGTGAALCDNDLYVAAGATTRGGDSETDAFHALDTEGDGLGCLR